MSLRLQDDSNTLRQKFLNLHTPEDVSALLEINYKSLIYYLYRFPQSKKYQTFSVRKRRGGTRQLFNPNPSLKILQQKLNQVLQCVYRPRPSVKGFIQGESIAKNAQLHENKLYVGNIDLKDFFPSINFGRVRGLFIAAPYKLPEKVATVLTQLCCHDNTLPQGAPTSPIISNMICSRLDTELQRFASRWRCIYSRYADDLTFSTATSPFPQSIISEDTSTQPPTFHVGSQLQATITANGFEVNPNKTRLRSKWHRQEVTGLVVNQWTNVSRRYVRQIRAMLHAWEKHGLDNAQHEYVTRYNTKDRAPQKSAPSFKLVVKGKLDFLLMVRGYDNLVYKNLLSKYAALVPNYCPKPVYRQHNHLSSFKDAIWIIECIEFEDCIQGTGFFLKGFGLVTCYHVAKPLSKAYHPSAPDIRYPIQIIASDKTSDLARLKIDTEPSFEFQPSWLDHPTHGTPVTIAGYPQYAPGMSLWLSQGTVAGHRQRMASPRVLINGQIIGGASGSPVLDPYRRVIGVAATGSAYSDSRVDEAFHSFIPITLLKSL